MSQNFLHGAFIFVLVHLYASFTTSQVICDTPTCTFNGQNYKNQVLECTSNVNTCSITQCQNQNQCQRITLKSAAKTTTITCQNAQSCQNIDVECNGQNIDSCQFKCANGNSCGNVAFTCSGDIDSCIMIGQTANSISGSMTCDVSEPTNQCTLDLQNGGWASNRITLNCLSGLDNCECQNPQFQTACNAAKVVTAKPTTSPTTSMPTSSPSGVPTTVEPTISPSRNPSSSPVRGLTFSPTKSPTRRPITSGLTPTNPPTDSPVIIVEEIKADTNNKSNLTGLYVIIVILLVLLFGFGMWYYAKHGYKRNGEKHIVAPSSPSSIVHLQNEGNFAEGTNVNTGYDLEGGDAVNNGPGATNENDALPKKSKNDHQSMDVDDIVNIDEDVLSDELKENEDDDLIINEIETAQGPRIDDDDDIDFNVETMG